jgi:hypothetical protein
MIEPETRWRRIEAALFLTPFLSFAYFYQGSDQSTAARFDLMRAIVERQTLWIDGYCGYNTADIISVGGHYYSVKAPGGSLTGLIQWIFFSWILSPLSPNHEALYWALATYLTIVFSTGLLIASACVVMYRCSILFGATPGRAAALALILPFATIAFPYGTEMTGEPIAAACLLISFYLLATHSPEQDAGRAMFAGAIAGWAVLCDFPAVLIASALAIYAIARLDRGRHLIAFGGGAIAVAILLFAYNTAAFGHPLFLSYEAYRQPANSQFPEQAVGFVGLTYPRLDVLSRILTNPQRGLFFCNPVLVLVLPALGFFAHRRRLRAECLVTVFAVISMVLFNASFGESIISWGGGTATGPRQIIAAIPFMVLALVFIPAEWDLMLAGLALLSVFAMLMATAVEPHLPYEYGNPLRDFTLPAYLRGEFAYNRDAYFGGPPIVDESTAFNLGKLAGLRGPIQLWPLAAFWIAGGLFLLRELDVWPRGSANQRFASAGMLIAVVALFVPPAVCAVACPTNVSAKHGLLGHYYRGAQAAGVPAHIVRVDSELDFHNVAELGALPAPSYVIWTGTLIAPEIGTYRFNIDVDDAGWLKIDGVAVIPDPGDQTLTHASGDIRLTAGPHRIEAGERNLAGDASMVLSWQSAHTASQVVPYNALVPAAAAGPAD